MCVSVRVYVCVEAGAREELPKVYANVRASVTLSAKLVSMNVGVSVKERRYESAQA